MNAVFEDGSNWDVSTMTALMPARRSQHGKKEATVCWLGEHAVRHHKLAVQFRCHSGRTDIVLLEQTEQVCQRTLWSVSGTGDTEEQAFKDCGGTDDERNPRQARLGVVTSSHTGMI